VKRYSSRRTIIVGLVAQQAPGKIEQHAPGVIQADSSWCRCRRWRWSNGISSPPSSGTLIRAFETPPGVHIRQR